MWELIQQLRVKSCNLKKLKIVRKSISFHLIKSNNTSVLTYFKKLGGEAEQISSKHQHDHTWSKNISKHIKLINFAITLVTITMHNITPDKDF